MNIISFATLVQDFWRYIVFSQALYVASLTTFIIIRYIFLFIHTPSKNKALPLHIICIATSYLALTICALFEMRVRLGEPYTWRTPSYLFAFTLGDLGLIFMLISLSVKRNLVKAVLSEAARQAKVEMESKHQENKATLKRIESKITETAKHVEQVEKKVDAI